MSLPRIFTELYALTVRGETPERPGEAFKRLDGGATITVRSKGRRRQVILGRAGAPVGETEIVTFRRDGTIPDDAERKDYQSASGWHYVALTWMEAPGPLRRGGSRADNLSKNELNAQ